MLLWRALLLAALVAVAAAGEPAAAPTADGGGAPPPAPAAAAAAAKDEAAPAGAAVPAEAGAEARRGHGPPKWLRKEVEKHMEKHAEKHGEKAPPPRGDAPVPGKGKGKGKAKGKGKPHPPPPRWLVRRIARKLRERRARRGAQSPSESEADDEAEAASEAAAMGAAEVESARRAAFVQHKRDNPIADPAADKAAEAAGDLPPAGAAPAEGPERKLDGDARAETDALKAARVRLAAAATWEGVSDIVESLDKEAAEFEMFDHLPDVEAKVPAHDRMVLSRTGELQKLVRQEVDKEFGSIGERLRVQGEQIKTMVKAQFDSVRAKIAQPLARWRENKWASYRVEAERRAREHLGAFNDEIEARKGEVKAEAAENVAIGNLLAGSDDAAKGAAAAVASAAEGGEGFPRLRETSGALHRARHAAHHLTAADVKTLTSLVAGVERLMVVAGAHRRAAEAQQRVAAKAAAQAEAGARAAAARAEAADKAARAAQKQAKAAGAERLAEVMTPEREIAAERDELERLEAVQQVLLTKRRLQDEEEEMAEATRAGLEARLAALEDEALSRSRRVLGGDAR